MKVLLDENFPLALLRSLLKDGQQAEHIITMGWRGAPDQRIRELLLDRSVLFLTHDEDFLFDKKAVSIVVLSRVRQSRRLGERVQELIAHLLGVRRESITQTASKLKKDGLIAYVRGRMTILDRPKLEQRVCECYSTVKAEYDRLLPHPKSAADTP